MIRPEKYRSKLNESRRRLALAESFQEPDRVPVQISVAGSYFSKMQGINIRDFYLDLETNLRVQLEGLEWVFEELQDDRTEIAISYDPGPVYEGLFFGAEIDRPDDTSPWIVPFLETREDVEKLKVPDPENHPAVQDVYRKYEQAVELVRQWAPGVRVYGGFGIHPPLSAACAIMAPERVYELFYDDTDTLHLLFDKMFEAFCKLQDYRDKYFGERTVYLALADDNSAFISDEMYREHVLPYNLALYERYGTKGRFLHADGPNDHHFKTYAEIVKLTKMDIGGWSSLEKAVEDMKGKVVISGGLNNRDFYEGWEKARHAVERAIDVGAPGGGFILAIGGETYPGVPPDLLCKAVAHAKEYGCYDRVHERLEARVTRSGMPE